MKSNSSIDKESLQNEKEIKKNKEHSSMVKKYISNRRTIFESKTENKSNGIRYKYKRYSLPSNINIDNEIDIIKIMDKIKTSLDELKSYLKF